MLAELSSVWAILDRKSRRTAYRLLVLMMVGAATEALGVGLILPLLTALTDEAQLAGDGLLGRAYRFSGADTPTGFSLFCMVALAIVYLVKGVLAVTTSYTTYHVVFSASSRLAVRLYGEYVCSPYTFHLSTNSATLVRNIIHLPVEVCGSMLRPVLVLATESLVIVAVVAVLLIAEPQATIVAGCVLGAIATVYFVVVRRHLQRWGEQNVSLAKDRIQWTNEGMASIKEIKVSGCEQFVTDRYQRINDAWARIKVLSSTVAEVSRPVLEVAVILLILAGAIYFNQAGYSGADFLAVLGLFGVAATRILPSISRITVNVSQVRMTAAALETLKRDMEMFDAQRSSRTASSQSVPHFNRDIRLQNIAFKYPDSDRSSLSDINLTVRHGESVAFVGSSGAGKTTLCNILIGLLEPSAGRILVDGTAVDCIDPAWRTRIGYIPQDIYLLDDSVRRNVAFGLDDSDIDDAQVMKALKMAQLDDTVLQLPHGLDTILGERGARLSGGQRQRIAIARSLYRDPEILILDEATSALDAATETEINNAVKQLAGEKTIIVVAHRVSTVQSLDTLFFLEQGRLIASGTFGQLSQENPEFRRIVLGKVSDTDALEYQTATRF